jgi:hypothetical protein
MITKATPKGVSRAATVLLWGVGSAYLIQSVLSGVP